MALNVRTKSPAPYQTLMLPQDTQEEEEVVSLANGFDNEVDPFSIEQPVAPVELDSSLYGGQARPFVDTVANIIGSEAATTSEAPVPLDASQYGTIPSEKYTPVDWSDFDPSMFEHLGLDNLGSIGDGLDAGLLAAESDRQRTEQIGAIGLDRGSFTDDEFSSNTAYFDKYVPKREEFKQGQRDALTDLFATDSEQFGTVFEQLGANSKLNFLEGQYSAGSLAKDKYLELAQQILGGNPDSGNQYFIKGEKLYKVSNTFANDSSALSHSREVILFDNQKLITNNKRLDETQLFRDAIGSTNYESANTGSKWVKARDNVLRPLANITASIATGGMSDAVQAAVKGAKGETLKGSDWASLASAGLNFADVTKAGTGAAAGGMGPVDTGTGLFGSTYNQTQGLIKAAGAGDLKEAAVGLVLPKILEGVKSKLPPNSLLSLPESFEAGLSKTIEEMAGGSSFEDALKVGGIEYIREGGLKPIEGALKDALEPLVDTLQPVVEQIEDTLKPLGDVLSAADTAARQGLAEFDKTVLQQFTQPVGDVLSQADTAVRQGAAAFDKEVLQPFTQPAGDVIEDVAQATGDVAEDVGQEVGDALSAAETAVRQALGDIDLPDGPDIDLPDIDIDLPNIGLGMLTGASTLSPTRTTDDIFKEDLFKFKTKIEVSPIEQLLRSPQARQQQQEVVGLYDDPFASSFDERNTFQL